MIDFDCQGSLGNKCNSGDMWFTINRGLEIQKYAGVLQGQGAKKGLFITTGSFSKNPQELFLKLIIR